MKAVTAIALCLLLSGCGSSSEDRVASLDVRQLSGAEKLALGQSLSRGFKNPGSVQFKWMPILTPHTEESKWLPTMSTPKMPPAGYCGLANEGGGGFRVFSAVIIQSSGGQYDRGTIERVEGAPAGADGSVRDRCKNLGYADFNLAT